MISQIQELHSKFSELKKTGKDLKEAAGKFVPDDDSIATIYVRTLFDGNNRLSLSFVSAVCANLNVNVKFEYLPITKAIDEDLPLILISDDTEIDNETAAWLEKRKRIAAPTFPMIIFSNEYFILREGESLAYVQTCDILERYSERPVMPFRHQDLFDQRDILSLYVECVAETVALYRLRKSLETADKKNARDLEDLYKKYSALPTDNDIEHMLEKLSLNRELMLLAELCTNIEKIVKKIRSHADDIDGYVNSLHQEYDKHIISVITHKETNDNSAYSVKLDLKYGMLKGYLKKLCTEAERVFQRDEFEKNLAYTVSHTRTVLDSNVAELAFIGTFSSGKTTLINTLLGHEHKLRTSGAHNTAVLMELVATQDDKEYYEVIYKDRLKWDLIHYNSFDNKNIINTFDCEAQVISVEENKMTGSTTVRYKAVKGNDIRIAEIGNGHHLAVIKGAIVGSKKSFIKQEANKSVVRLCSFSELSYIEALLDSKNVSDIRLSALGGEIRNITEIQRIISQLKPFYTKFQNNSVQPTISVDKIKEKWGGAFEKLANCTFECKLFGFRDKKFTLDEVGWEKFIGNEAKNIAPFCESPACYMPAKAVRLYLNSEFLKYCTITDTPGFGSITDEHDAITERYLRDSDGKLVVMITINNHSSDRKLDDLLHNISGVFKNFRKSQMGDVCFVLNCFTNLLPFEQCKKSVEEIKNKIRDLGFTQNDIYVDNLRHVLDSNSDKRVFMEPFPSYYSFKSDCLSKFLETSIDQRYEGLWNMWDSFFRENISWIEDRIDSITRTLNDKESRIVELRNIIRQINSVEICTGEDLINKKRKLFDDYFENFDSAFRENRKGIFKHHRWNAISAVFDTFVEDSETWESDEKELENRMLQAFRRLSFYAKESDCEEVDCMPKQRLIVATFEKIRSKLKEADNNTHWHNRGDRSDYYMSQLRDIINQDKERTTDNIRSYCRIYMQAFDVKKEFLLKNFNYELEKSSDQEALQKKRTYYLELLDKLHIFKTERFDKIEFKK